METKQIEKPYWCHLCQNQFVYPGQNITSIQCPYCKQNVVEQITLQNRPQQFQAYQLQVGQTSIVTQLPSLQINISDFRSRQGIQSIYNGLSQFFQGLCDNQQERQIVQNMVHSYSNMAISFREQIQNLFGSISHIPATQNQIQKLELIDSLYEECVICQNIQATIPESNQINLRTQKQAKKCFKLPCGHVAILFIVYVWSHGQKKLILAQHVENNYNECKECKNYIYQLRFSFLMNDNFIKFYVYKSIQQNLNKRRYQYKIIDSILFDKNQNYITFQIKVYNKVGLKIICLIATYFQEQLKNYSKYTTQSSISFNQIMDEANDYQIVIIQCCQNCQSHQSITKHSQWKYYEHFNQLKKKIQRYVANAIVIKNPVPDELHQPIEPRLGKNVYINKNTQEKIIFPRVGSFQVYIYNILISSKLSSGTWPNHYKILQILTKITTAKKQGLPLDQFSIYNEEISNQGNISIQKKQTSPLHNNTQKVTPQQQPQARRKIVSKKKNSTNHSQSISGNKFRVYKSKEPKTATLDQSSSNKNSLLEPLPKDKQRQKIYSTITPQTNVAVLKAAQQRYLESKQQNRKKLPSLRNTINLLNSSQNKKNVIEEQSLELKKSKPIFNSIDETLFGNGDMSIIEKDNETLKLLNSFENGLEVKDHQLNMNRFDSLVLYNNDESILGLQQNTQSPASKYNLSPKRKYSLLNKNKKPIINSQNQFANFQNEFQDIRIVENKSVQWSQEHNEVKDLMNRSIQYERNAQQVKDFCVQIDGATLPKQVTYQFVQTQKVDIQEPETQQQKKKKQAKPYMLDESIQANIIIKRKQKHIQIQTIKPQIVNTDMNTDVKAYINRGYQYPDEAQLNQRNLPKIQLDKSFIHLYEKRRNLPIDENQTIFSVDKFQQKATKYKWIGKAEQNVNFKDLKHKLLLETLVFAVYNFFGIKTPEKRISFLQCSNVLAEKINVSNSALHHILSQQNPEIQYFSQFEELDVKQKIFPLSQEITYRSSKQKIKFNNWGKFLALVYILDDANILDSAPIIKKVRKDNLANISKQLNKNQSIIQNELNQVHSKYGSSIGLVITNEQVKQIYRMNCQNYQLFTPPSNYNSKSSQNDNKDELIFLTSNRKDVFINPKRLSKSVQLQFISMLSRLTLDATFNQLKLYLNDIFVNKSKVYDQKFCKLFDSIQKYQQYQQINLIKYNNLQNSPNLINKKNIQNQLQQNNGKQLDQLSELMHAFIDKLKSRICLISQTYKGKIYTYRKYKSLQAKVSYKLPNNPIINRQILVSYIANSQKPQSQLKIQLDDAVKMLRNYSNMLFLSGQQGSGKSLFLQNVKKSLEQLDKYNILYFRHLKKLQNCQKIVEDKFFQKRKNILLIDNLQNQKDTKLIVKLIKAIIAEKQDKYDVSYLFVIKSNDLFEPLTLKLNSLVNKNISREQKFIHLKLQPLSEENIKLYISKAVDFKNVAQKNDLSQKILKSIDKTPALRNPLYLNLYCQIIEEDRLDQFIREYDPNKICKWYIMKKTFENCDLQHKTQLESMGIQFSPQKDIYFELRQLVIRLHVMERYPQSYLLNSKLQKDKSIRKQDILANIQEYKLQLIQQLFNQFEQNQQRLIKNHLQFYPVDLKYLVKIKTQKANLFQDDDQQKQVNYKDFFKKQTQQGSIKLQQFFIQSQFYQFILAEGFAYYLSKGFKNLDITDITLNPQILKFIRQKSQHQPSFCQNLLELVYDTQIYPSLSQQGSNALTLLCQLNYQFSNLTFDHCQLQDTDLSLSTFYNCSFRDTNLMNAIMYKTSFMNCSIDATQMDNINLFIKKYQIEWTPLCCSISRDGKQLALGCGNYLVILATESGKQIKKMQAHLDVIRSVKFSKDGNYLISIADDKTLRSWDTQSYKSVVFKLPQKGGAVFFSNQSETIATIVNKNDLKVWNIKSMANQALFEGHSDQITSVSFSTNGEYILTGSKDTTISLWNLKGKQLYNYKGHQKQIICAKISPTNAIIASSSKQKQLILFQTLSQSIVAKKQFQSEIIEICLDLKQIFICCAFAQDQKISVLSFTTLEIIHQLTGHKQKIVSINFDSSFQKLISLSKDRTVRLWDLQKIMKKQLTARPLNLLQKTTLGPALAVSYCRKLGQYATGHQNGQINIWDDKTNTIVHKLTDHHGYVSKLQYDSTGKLYSGGKDGTLRIWNFQKIEEKKKQPYRKIELFSVQLLDLKINEKNRIIVTSSVNNELVVYDFTGIKIILSTRDEGKVHAIAFDEKDKFMAIGGVQRYVVTYKIQNQGNTLTRSQQLGQHPQIITSIAYQGDSLLISVLKNGHIYIWNHLKANLIKKIENISPITCLSIFNRKFGCLSSEDGKIRIINLDEGKQVKIFKYKDTCLKFVTRNEKFNPQNSKNLIPLLYAVCKDGNIIKWNLQSITKAIQKSISLPPLMTQQKKASKFGRKAVNEDGSLMVQVEGQKSIKLKNLHEHTEQIIKIDKCPSIIEGVEFIELPTHLYRQDDKVVNAFESVMLLLKSGQYWSLRSNKLFDPLIPDESGTDYLIGSSIEGDLYYIKQKQTLFYKSGIKKISKQIRKPTQLVVDQVTIGG